MIVTDNLVKLDLNETDKTYQKTEYRFAVVEHFLDGPDLCPGLSVLSGSARSLMGACQLIYYGIMAIVHGCSYKSDEDSQGQSQERAWHEIALASHGLANIVKGFSNTSVGIIYNWVNLLWLHHRYAYPNEVTSITTYRLFDGLWYTDNQNMQNHHALAQMKNREQPMTVMRDDDEDGK